MKTRNILVIGGVLVLIGVAVAYYMYNKPHKNYQEADASFTGQAAAFYSEATTSQTDFLKKYLNQAVVLEGQVFSIESATSIILAPAILCQVNSEGLIEGATITLKGRVVGAEEDLLTGELLINLDNCELK
jgi:hypothetical protein